MKILIDALSARIGGGVTYMENMLRVLSDLNNPHTLTILLSPRYQQHLIDMLPPDIKLVQADLPAEPLSRRWWYQQTELPRLLQEMGVDLFFAVGESSYFRVPSRFVMMARNQSLYASPKAFGSRRWRMLMYRMVRQPLVFLALQKADRVIFVSAAFRDQVVSQIRLNPAKTRVIHHGVSPIFAQATAKASLVGDSTPYFLSVSTINPHKNYETLLMAYARLPKDVPHLVIAGALLDQPTYYQLQSIIAEMRIGDRVHFLGAVPYENLPALYQGAECFIFPSRLESFGHPLVEAMASGTPVIASDLPVCREICQDAALYFDPGDVESLATQMLRLCHDESTRDTLAQRGRVRAHDFSWEESARKLIEVFEELV